MWILILEEYSLYLEYITGDKNIVADPLPKLTIISNQNTTHKPTYTTKKISKEYDIKGIPEGMYPITSKMINRHQWKVPRLMEKFKCRKYQTGSYYGSWNNIILVIYKYK